MIFLTVGTQFPFDRLVKAVDIACGEGLVAEEIFAQIGESSYKPRNFEYVKSLDKNNFDSYVNKCSAIISHGGMGTISIAMDNNRPLLVMPRLAKYGEVVNDHQVDLARKFAELGHIISVASEEELSEKIKQLKTFVPKPRSNQSHLVTDRVRQFLDGLACESQRR